MKILIINDYNTSLLGGGEIHIKELIKLLIDNGNSVEFVYGEKTGKGLHSIYNREFKQRIANTLSNNNFDVIHIHSLSRNISTSFLKTLKETGVPILMTVHSFVYNCPKSYGIKKGKICFNKTIFECISSSCNSYSNHTGIMKFLEDSYKVIKIKLHGYYMRRYVDIFICPSKELKNAFAKNLGLLNNQAVYLPNFIRLPSTYKLNQSGTNAKKFIFVGRLSKEKGVEVIINAYNYIIKNGNTDILLDIIGDGPEEYNLKKKVTEFGLDGNINFLGRIQNEALKSHYEECACVLIPSICLENNPLVAIEAMKFGKPIIGTNIGGLPDLIEDGKNGYLFHFGNHINLSEKIMKIYGDREKILEMGLYGNYKAIAEFNEKLYLSKLISLYKLNNASGT